jgi:hypothetical protein
LRAEGECDRFSPVPHTETEFCADAAWMLQRPARRAEEYNYGQTL